MGCEDSLGAVRMPTRAEILELHAVLDAFLDAAMTGRLPRSFSVPTEAPPPTLTLATVSGLRHRPPRREGRIPSEEEMVDLAFRGLCWVLGHRLGEPFPGMVRAYAEILGAVAQEEEEAGEDDER